VAFAAVALAAVAGVVLTAATDKHDLAFTLGVVTTGIAVDIPPGGEACQRPIHVPAGFGAVRVRTGTFFRPPPPLDLTVKDAATRRPLAHTRFHPGPEQISIRTVRVARVPAGRDVSVCFRNAGRRVAGLYGGEGTPGSEALLSGKRVELDIDLVFLREQPASALSLVPEMFRRAALFHPGWVGAWTFWLLAALIVLLVPALLARALATAERD
jgi:hypothetical protein